ncbi:MAG: VWA domain-containing protein, partial [Candidatus Sulfotelmatobacter sp.]
MRLLFLATDEHNHTVQDLQPDDFAVVDDERVIREFRSFTRSDAVYLNVVVLIDSSESVLPRFRQEIKEVAQLISQSPWNSRDQISVLAFGGIEPEFICDGNCRESFSPDRIVPRGGATPLLDAIEMATTLLVQRGRPECWPVILLFSDGDDTISKASLSQVREEILNSGEQIYA